MMRSQFTGARVEYTPTLLIGLGGTGVKAVRHILLHAEGVDGQPPMDDGLATALKIEHIVAVGIDTSTGEFSDKPVKRETLLLSDAEALDQRRLSDLLPRVKEEILLNANKISGEIASMREAARITSESGRTPENEPTASWILRAMGISHEDFDETFPAENKGKQGAAQFRALGRIALLSDLEGVIQRLRTAFDAVNMGRSEGVTPEIVIFSSLAGGTGAGMFLDIAAIVRQYINKNVPISGHFLLPDVFRSAENTSRIAPNAYAALRELSELAQPRNAKPVEISYKIQGVEESFTFRKGDTALFDNVYLYGMNASRLDWTPANGAERSTSTLIRTASRAMADGARTLMRRDVYETLTGKQNERQIYEVTKGSNAGFHSITSVPLSPLRLEDLSRTLLREIGRECLWKIQTDMASTAKVNEIKGCIESAEKLALGETNNTASKSVHEIIQKKKQAIVEAKWLNDENIEFCARNAFQEGDEGSSATSGPRAAGMQENNSVKRTDVRTLFDEFGVTPLVEWCFEEAFGPKTRRNFQKGKRRMNIENAPISGLFYASDARSDVDQIRTELENLGNLAEIYPIAAKEPISNLRQHSAFLEPETRFKLKEKLRLHIPIEIQTYREHLGLSLNLYTEQERNKALRYIDRWKPIGSPGDGFRSILYHLLDDVSLRLEDVDTRALARSGPEFIEEIAELGTSLEALLSRTDKAIERWNQRNSMLLRNFGPITGVDFDFETDRALFNSAFAPLDRMVAELSPADDGLFGAGAWTLQNRRRARKSELATQIEIALADAVADMDKNAPTFSEEAFFETLASTLRAQPRRGVTPANALTALAQAVHQAAFGRDCILHSFQSHDGFDKLVQAIDSFSKSLVRILIGLKEFEVARFGGDDAIKKRAGLAMTDPFGRVGAAGEPTSRYAFIALPASEHGSGAGQWATSSVHSVLYTLLGRSLYEAPVRSAVPILAIEKRFRQARQINEIVKWRVAYEAVGEGRQSVFHVIPEAVEFPHVVESPASGVKPEFWTCNDHIFPEKTNGEEQFCSKCMDEFVDGKRRLSDVKTRPGSSPIRPGEFNADGSFGEKFLVSDDVSIFDDGLPSWRRTSSEVDRLSMLATEDAHFGGHWDPYDPPFLIFPQTPTPSGDALEHVARDPRQDNHFVRGSTGGQVGECYHCGFPLATEMMIDENIKDIVCPRCRRDVTVCPGCTSNDGFYVQRQYLDAEKGASVCSRCSSELPLS